MTSTELSASKRRELLALLAALADELDGAPYDVPTVVRGHRPIVVRMAYAEFLRADHAAVGGFLIDHHLQDSTVLCAYRGIARPHGAIQLLAGTARTLELPGA